MDKKKLPKIKKTVSSFVTNEDAKVMNKTATKMTVSATFATSVLLFNMDSGNAFFSHDNHMDHSNVVDVHTRGRTGFDLGSGDAGEPFRSKFHLFDAEEAEITNIHHNHTDHSDSGGYISDVFGGIGDAFGWDDTYGDLFGEDGLDWGGGERDDSDPEN